MSHCAILEFFGSLDQLESFVQVDNGQEDGDHEHNQEQEAQDQIDGTQEST
jgi:hypothetical protein